MDWWSRPAILIAQTKTLKRIMVFSSLYLLIKSGSFLRYFDFWSVIRRRHVGLTCYINSHELPPLILPQVEQVLFHIHHVTRCLLPVWVGFSLHPVSSSNIVTPKSMDEFEADNTMLFVLVPLWCYHCLPVSWTVAEKEFNCALFSLLAIAINY